MVYRSRSFKLPSPEELRAKLVHRAEQRGVTMAGHRLWTDDEIAILRALAPEYGEIQKLLTRRTHQAIRLKCNLLGLPTKAHIWTGAEISRLRQLYRSAPREQVLAAFPFSNWQAIESTAWRHNIQREKPPYRKVSHPLMNAILDRCAAIGWTLLDLDDECQTGHYFRGHAWRKNRPNAKAVLKAVEVLGGSVSVVWDD